MQRATGTIGFVEPCYPSRAKQPPAGAGWLHEIKHDNSGVQLLDRSLSRATTRG
jgi:hypothetical protein